MAPYQQPLPPDQQALAAAHRQRQQQLARAAVAQMARLWLLLEAANLATSWTRVAPRALALMRAAMVSAARGAQSYVDAAATNWGLTPDPVGTVPTAVFAATASDGRPLDTLLGVPAFEAQAFIDQGKPAPEALSIGKRHLERIVVTQVADAARVATGVAVANDRSTTGYVRMLTPPSCSRCVVLAGRWYAWNDGFARHPQCDCVHIPASEDVAGDVRTDPKAYFDSLDEADQDRIFTKAGARALRDGADLGRVVNARRGMYTAGGRLLTREATTRRGTGKRVRLMPEQIYREAGGDRDEAIRLLKRFGYIV